MRTKHPILFAAGLLILFFSCNTKSKEPSNEMPQENKAKKEMTVKTSPVYDQNDPRTILASIAHAHGGWNDLWKKKDVQYTYTYHDPNAQKTDLSTERYIFDNEASYGHYTKHEINAMPQAEGPVTQFFDGSTTTVMVAGKKTDDPQGNAVGDFLRRANYFWFVMPYKLNDKGTIATYEGQETHKGQQYDKVKITYDPAITGKEQNDVYILFVNPKTKLIDRFYFSLPFLGIEEPLIIADYFYEEKEGQKIATRREYYLPSENGYASAPNLVQTLTDIRFNNGFTKENIMN